VPGKKQEYIDRAVAQAVSRTIFTAETRVRAKLSPCWICGGQSVTGISFLRVSPVNIIPPWLSIYSLIYHLLDEK
jgi:preprotein translocase subunit SecF